MSTFILPFGIIIKIKKEKRMEIVKNKTRGRPKSFNREDALNKALKVFWARGYEGASLAELTEKIGINKPSLYASFGNKEELFRQALKKYMQDSVSYVGEAIQAPTTRLVVENFLMKSAVFLVDDAHPKGCMIAQGALNCSDDAAFAQQELMRLRGGYEAALRQRFETACEEGELPKGTDASALAKYVATVHQGMSIQATSGATQKELIGVVNLVLKNWPT
jgi:AcrR family transcriptional regulator